MALWTVAAGGGYPTQDQSLDLTSASASFFARGVFWRGDGSSVYVLDANASKVWQWNLSTAYDLTTASLFGSVTVAGTEDMAMSSDGSKMYVLSGFGSTLVTQYTLSTAWDVTTASASGLTKNVSAQDSDPMGVAFGNAGARMYISGNTNNRIYQYNLSTAWDVSSATYSTFKGGQSSRPEGVFFNDDGTRMWELGNAEVQIYEYSVSTPWDVSTATYGSTNLGVGAGGSSQPRGFTISSEGAYLLVVETTNKRAYRWKLGDPPGGFKLVVGYMSLSNN